MLKAISLFTGAGGIDYGFEAAGFETTVALEMDAACCETLRANRSFPVIDRNIHHVSSEEILEKAGVDEGEAAVLHGGPPCQPFSKSGYWRRGDSGRLEDPRAQTLDAYMRVVHDTLPLVFLLENVHGISYSGKEEGFHFLQMRTAEINRAKRVSYALSWQVLNTQDYGVPQARERFFLVGQREGRRFRFPAPTHGDGHGASPQGALFAEERLPLITAWDAIGDLTSPHGEEDLAVGGHWADLLPSIPEGENYLWHTNRKGGLPLFGWRTRYWSFLLKLAKSRPSWTIQAQPGSAVGPFHWENRRLSAVEMARLQTFPDRLSFAGGRTALQRQLGNAVPSLMAEVLARAIAQQFFGAGFDEAPKLSVEPKRPIPPPEPVKNVPKKYLGYAGDHADHPGEGKGRLARRDKGSQLVTGD